MQRIALATAVTFVWLAATPALSQQQDWTRAQYLAASNCVAHAELDVLESDAPNVDALEDAVDDHARRVPGPVRAEAESREDELERNARRGQISVEQLRADRDRICAPFVQSGLVGTRG